MVSPGVSPGVSPQSEPKEKKTGVCGSMYHSDCLVSCRKNQQLPRFPGALRPSLPDIVAHMHSTKVAWLRSEISATFCDYPRQTASFRE
jgi:hypothetical protein